MPNALGRPTCRHIVETTTEWMEGTLAGAERDRFESHLESCRGCRRFVLQLGTTAELTREWAASEVVSAEREGEILSLLSGFDPPEDVAESGVERSPVDEIDQLPERRQEGADSVSCIGLDASTARAYLEDRLPDEQQIAVLEHLIEGCESCRRTCVEIAFPELVDRLAPRVSMAPEPLSAGLRARYERELRRLTRIWKRGDRTSETSSDVDPEDFLLWLIQRGRDLTESEPREAIDVASIAVGIGEGLDLEFRVRAAMLQGVVSRKVDGDFVASNRWFATARELARRCRSSELLEAKVLSLWAFSNFSRSRLHRAITLYEQALKLYREGGDIPRWAECLMDMTRPCEELEPASSITDLLRCSCLVDWEAQGRRAMAMGQYLALSYVLLGRSSRARAAVSMCRRRFKDLNLGRSVELRLDWTEARITNSELRFEEAYTQLRSIRDEFLELDLPAFAAFVSVDLSVSLIGLGRWQELREVAEPMAAFFISRDISGEAAVALRLFRDAVAAETLTIANMHALRKYLR